MSFRLFSHIEKSTFIEVYGAGRIVQAATARRRALNVRGLSALDLRTLRADGQPWDFRLAAHRRDALDLIERLQPMWVVGSPPCTAFCQMNTKLNFKRMAPEKVRDLLADGRLHLTFMAQIYRKQLSAGRYFLHEHPSTAASWRESRAFKRS